MARRELEKREPEREHKGMLEDRSLNQENRSLLSENRSLNQENRSLNQENRSLNQENRSLNQENRSLNQENRSLNQENRSLNQEIGRCGVFTAEIVDPVSELLSWYVINPNAVGVYYTVQERLIVRLYNTYDSTPVTWFRLGGSLDRLLSLGYVSTITFYPLADTFQERLQQSLSTLTKEYTPLPHEKHRSFTRVLSRQTPSTTGYTLVNRLIQSTLQRSGEVPADRLVSMDINVVMYRPSPPDKYLPVPEESQRELVQLAAIFVEMFSRCPEMRREVVNQKRWPELCMIQSQIIALLLGQKWDRVNLLRLMNQANDHRQSLALPMLSLPEEDTGPILALGVYLQSLPSSTTITDTSELRRIYNRLATIHQLPEINIPQTPSLYSLERMSWASMSDQELIHILAQLDALDMHIGVRNELIAELASRRQERN